MLNGVKHLNASTCANRFLTPFEMTGKKKRFLTLFEMTGEKKRFLTSFEMTRKKESGKQFPDSLGGGENGEFLSICGRIFVSFNKISVWLFFVC